MSPAQAPVCTTDYPRTCKDAALIRTEFPHPNAFYSGASLEEENAAMRKRAENFSQNKLPTYRAAAVMSTILAGVESQLLVFFKSSPDFTRQPVPVTIQYLLVLTYIALIFSVSATISSLVLTRNSGNVPTLVRRWRLLECHWLFTLVISVLCLPAQILLYTWTQEREAITATILVAGVFAMFPVLHFLPIFWRAKGAQRKRNLPPFLRDGRWVGFNGYMLPAPMSLPSSIYTVDPASQMSR